MPAISLNKNVISIILLAIAIFFGGLIIVNNTAAIHRDSVATGFLCDLLITFPMCYYFIIIRPLKKSGRGMLLVFAACCGVAYLVLPAQQRQMIIQARKLSSVVELVLLGYAVTKIKKIVAAYKIRQIEFADPLYNLRGSMHDVFGDVVIVRVLASEMAILRYGLLFWKKEKSVSNEAIAFSTHRESGYIAIWCIFLAAVLVEIVAFHLLLMRWSKPAAIITTFISVYGIVFFIADLSAILKRKVLINNDSVILRTGLRWQVRVLKSEVAAVNKIVNDYQSDENYLKGGIMNKNGNVLIKFKAPVTVERLYGSPKQVESILMNIDDVERFITELYNLS